MNGSKEVTWKYEKEPFFLEILANETMENVTAIRKSDNIAEDDSEIRHKFLDSVFELKMSQLINKEDGFDDADEEEDEIEKFNPYNPKLIRVDTKTFSVSMVNQMINDREIDLSPDFQRGFVWTDITRKSRLIESLLLRIPIPAFYFSQDEEGLFQVVDGVQRLTVLNSFMNNEFKLKNLEYLTECNGKWFKNPKYEKEDSLDSIYIRRIEQTQLFVNIIDPQTPGRVKYDIFKRINTGGKALNNQEIRNCLASAGTRSLLHELSGSKSFLDATRGSISATRMADEELILRFIAFYLFGDRAFRKANYINKSLFLGISRVLCKFTLDQIKNKDKMNIVSQMNLAINNNECFRGALSMATNDARNVRIVYDVVNEIIGES